MDDVSFYVLYPIFISSIAYWGISGVWLFMDIFLAPHYRIKGGEIIDWKLYKKTAKHVLITQMTTTPFIMYALIPVWNYRGVRGELADDFFSFITLFKLSLCPPIGEFIFYFSHRLCHLNSLYSSVHKLHHEWKVPVAVAAAYTTKTEYVLCNLPTFLLPPLLLGLNWYAANIWFVFSTISVVMDHSGYIFFKNAVRHANHHKYTKYNYGAKKIDMLVNTEFRG